MPIEEEILAAFRARAIKSGGGVYYKPAIVQEMIDMADDEELAKALSSVHSNEMNILGIGVFGPKDKLKELTGTLQLWK